MSDVNYKLQGQEHEQPKSMQDILKNRLKVGLSTKLIQIMDKWHEQDLNITTFAEELADQVLSILGTLEGDLQQYQNQEL
jgi:hypothetical protein